MAPKRKAAPAKADSPIKRTRRSNKAAEDEQLPEPPKSVIKSKASAVVETKNSSKSAAKNAATDSKSTTTTLPSPSKKQAPAQKIVEYVEDKEVKKSVSKKALPKQIVNTTSSSSTAVSTAVEEDTYAELVTPQSVLQHWLATISSTVSTIGPTFISIAMLCYLIAATTSIESKRLVYARSGVVYLVVFAMTVILNVALGLPSILLIRLLESVSYGKRITWEVVLLSVAPVILSLVYYVYHKGFDFSPVHSLFEHLRN